MVRGETLGGKRAHGVADGRDAEVGGHDARNKLGKTLVVVAVGRCQGRGHSMPAPRGHTMGPDGHQLDIDDGVALQRRELPWVKNVEGDGGVDLWWGPTKGRVRMEEMVVGRGVPGGSQEGAATGGPGAPNVCGGTGRM